MDTKVEAATRVDANAEATNNPASTNATNAANATNANSTATATATGAAPHGMSPVIGLHGALRYPFAPMNLGWLHEYVAALGSTEKLVAMCRVLECLMANAVSTCDPFLEHAVVAFYTKFHANAWSKVQSHQTAAGSHDGMTFELSRQVFEVIGLIRRFPNATPKSRKMLLTLVERVLEDVTKVSLASPSLQHNRSIPEIVSSVKECVVSLRALHQQQQQQSVPSAGAIAAADGSAAVTATPAAAADAGGDAAAAAAAAATSNALVESAQAHIEDALQHLSSWLRYLFFALSSTRPVHVPACPPPPPGVQVIIPCSESCPCFADLRQGFPVYLSDVEKVKVIDSLVISGHGSPAEDEMAACARELLQRYSIEFCARAVAHVQNGKFALVRLYLFEALRLARRSQSIVSAVGVVEDARSLDLIDIALQRAATTCRDEPALAAVVTSLVPKSLASLARVRAARVVSNNAAAAAAAAAAATANGQQQVALVGGGGGDGVDHQQLPASAASAELFTLQKHLTSIFNALCNQQFLLCVHFVPFEEQLRQQQAKHQQLGAAAASAIGAAAAAAATAAHNAGNDISNAADSVPPPQSAASLPPPPKPPAGPPRCANPACGTSKGDLLKCSACKLAWYCSQRCQHADWKSHRQLCRAAVAERAQQQPQSPTAAAAQWLLEKCDKTVQGSRVVDIRPLL